jgi:hypothetical protein
MPALGAGIHDLPAHSTNKSWMAGPSPAMTTEGMTTEGMTTEGMTTEGMTKAFSNGMGQVMAQTLRPSMCLVPVPGGTGIHLQRHLELEKR